ncbi:DUF2975 domain-containing protein [Pedobacter sp. PWIIR3]
MKANLTTSRIINIVIGTGILLFIGFIVMIFWSSSVTNSDTTTTIDTVYASKPPSYEEKELPPIDPEIPATMPHDKYMHLKDSIKLSRLLKNGNLGSSVGMGFVNFYTMVRCERCNFFTMDVRDAKNKEYLLGFSSWKLDTAIGKLPGRVTYYVKDGQSYLRKQICKPDRINSNGEGSFTCHDVDQAVPFRIGVNNRGLMVPVGETTFMITRGIGIGLGVSFFIYFVYFVIGSFIKFLAEIAQGTPFSERNVMRLRFITLNLLIIPLGLFLIDLLVLPLIFHSYFTSDIKLDAESWKSLGKPAILCLIFATLYRAFKKGKALKEENDLTV